MSELWMHPATVTGWGSAAQGIGTDLVSTANIITGADGSSASVVSGTGGGIRAVNAITEVAI